MPKPEKTHKISDVFGITRDIPLNYVERNGIDDKLVDNLTRDQHIVIFGSSKQGKTCLRKHCLSEQDYIVVSCQNNMQLRQLHALILKAAGFSIKESSSKTIDGSSKVEAKFGLELSLPGLAKANVGTGAEGAGKKSNTINTKYIEIDISDPNDIITALESINFGKFIVLEDFHYLPYETQQDFSYALKAFHEKSDIIKITFIIVAVWREENRLILFNGDLTGRVIPIDADAWNDQQLRQVISQGEVLLNLQFEDSFKTSLIEQAIESVYIVQEACHRACNELKIYSTCSEFTPIRTKNSAEYYVKNIVNEQSGRYKVFLQNFALGFLTTDLEMYKWILYPVITASASQLEKGLTYRQIRESINSRHPEGERLRPGNITQALQQVSSLQTKKNMKPFVLDYDSANLLLSVVDKGFVVWLSTQDKVELLDLINLPTD